MNINFSLSTADPTHFIVVIVVICLFLVVKAAITAFVLSVICRVNRADCDPIECGDIREES